MIPGLNPDFSLSVQYAFLWGVIPALLANLISFSGNRESRIKAPVLSAVLVLIFNTLINFWILHGGQPEFPSWFSGFDLVFGNLLGAVLWTFVACAIREASNDNITSKSAYSGLISIVIAVIIIVGGLVGAAFEGPPLWGSTALATVHPVKMVKSLPNNYLVTDSKDLLVVPVELAEAKVHNNLALSGIPQLSTFAQVNHAYLQYIEQGSSKVLVWVVDLKVVDSSGSGAWNGFQTYAHNEFGGVFIVSATDPMKPVIWQPTNPIKIVPGGWWDQDILWYTNHNFNTPLGAPYKIDDLDAGVELQQLQREVTDSSGRTALEYYYQPYYIGTLLKPSVGLGGYKAVGVIVVNPTTGEKKSYVFGKDKIPSFIDHVYSSQYVSDLMSDYGTYLYHDQSFGSGNVGVYSIDNQTIVPIPGKGLYYQLTYTSKNADTSVSKVVFFNLATGEALDSPIVAQTVKTRSDHVGTEDIIVKNSSVLAANGPSSYSCEGIHVIYVENQTVYFCSLVQNGSNFEGVAFVPTAQVNNASSFAYGHTVQEGFNNLEANLANPGSGANVPTNINEHQVEGIVSGKSNTIIKNGKNCLRFFLKDKSGKRILPEKYFLVDQDQFPSASTTAIGNDVTVTYLDAGASDLQVVGFTDNTSS